MGFGLRVACAGLTPEKIWNSDLQELLSLATAMVHTCMSVRICAKEGCSEFGRLPGRYWSTRLSGKETVCVRATSGMPSATSHSSLRSM